MLSVALGIAIHNPDKVKLEHKLDEPLSWTTPLRSVLGDDFTLHDKYVTENASIEDSLSHRIGLSGHDLMYGAYLGDRPRELTKRVRFLGPLNKPFRTTMQYNNIMYAVAGDVLETLTDSTCSEALRALLWKPLGMDRTFWHLKEVVDAPHVNQDKDLSRGYYWVDGSKVEGETPEGGFYVPDNYVEFAGIAPAGSVISSVLDYTKWIQALLEAASDSNKDLSSSKNPITSTLFTELTSSRVTSTFPLPQNSQLATSSWGLGWNIVPALCGPSHPMMAHSGGLSGYGTMLYILPNDSFGVIAMGNTSLTANLVGGLLSQELMARKLGVKSPGRERELHEFDLLMKSQLVGLEHGVEAHPNDDDSEYAKAMMKNSAVLAGAKLSLDEFVQKKDQDISELQNFEGVYTNGAHSTYRISIVPTPSDLNSDSTTKDGSEKIDTLKSLYRFPRDKELNGTKDAIRANCYSLKITMEGGKRSWKYGYLLHPRVRESTKDTDTKSTDNTTTTWFDQEWFNGHGNQLEDDSVPGLPSGIDGEDGDGSGRCKGGKYWESVIWTRLGAAFVRDDQAKVKMGMTLGNTNFIVDGTRERRWEKNKVWFEREG